jgi:hypothetical protein
MRLWAPFICAILAMLSSTAATATPSCDESESYQSRPVDAANRRKQVVLFCKKEPKNSCL